MFNQIEYFLVDFDGTIADTEKIFDDFDGKFINDFLALSDVGTNLSDSQVRDLAGVSFKEKIEIISRRFNISDSSSKQEIIRLRESKRKNLFEDNPPQLAKNIDLFAINLGHKSAIVTNKTKDKLSCSLGTFQEIYDRFAYKICLEAGMKRKPAPDLLYKAMDLLGASSKSTAYIGDNVMDIQAAINADVLPIGFIIEGVDNNKNQTQKLFDEGAYQVIDDFSYFL